MKHINYASMPGPGDFLPRDDSREQAVSDAIADETEAVLNEWIADRRFYADYAAGFGEETWVELEQAVAHDDAIEMMRIYKQALREQMESDARKAAARRIHSRIANAKRDAEEERGMARTGW